ncbi:uncharacterized protein LMH87_008635 [Akanthomyces muscarius]|uniref:CENP-V/GFA domain-containing protein n=1 Tax=Akanthomyces muscarius TaxID=2231603 RepID=A0A9W8UPU5_AKAMU|nr:uncharacterized protein LMH87_008635 [Akanthomyces muscarius]KAJ4158091.1 hypothetical protein LMH87_008635 [Akanthomyces muscarius]
MTFQSGRCNCGSITVQLHRNVVTTIACHCLNCRRAGGAFSINYVVEDDNVAVNDPQSTISLYRDDDTESGNSVQRAFCQNCGCPIFTKTPALEGRTILKASLFADVVAQRGSDLFSNRKIIWE